MEDDPVSLSPRSRRRTRPRSATTERRRRTVGRREDDTGSMMTSPIIGPPRETHASRLRRLSGRRRARLESQETGNGREVENSSFDLSPGQPLLEGDRYRKGGASSRSRLARSVLDEEVEVASPPQVLPLEKAMRSGERLHSEAQRREARRKLQASALRLEAESTRKHHVTRDDKVFDRLYAVAKEKEEKRKVVEEERKGEGGFSPTISKRARSLPRGRRPVHERLFEESERMLARRELRVKIEEEKLKASSPFALSETSRKLVEGKPRRPLVDPDYLIRVAMEAREKQEEEARKFRYRPKLSTSLAKGERKGPWHERLSAVPPPPVPPPTASSTSDTASPPKPSQFSPARAKAGREAAERLYAEAKRRATRRTSEHAASVAATVAQPTFRPRISAASRALASQYVDKKHPISVHERLAADAKYAAKEARLQQDAADEAAETEADPFHKDEPEKRRRRARLAIRARRRWKEEKMEAVPLEEQRRQLELRDCTFEPETNEKRWAEEETVIEKERFKPLEWIDPWSSKPHPTPQTPPRQSEPRDGEKGSRGWGGRGEEGGEDGGEGGDYGDIDDDDAESM